MPLRSRRRALIAMPVVAIVVASVVAIVAGAAWYWWPGRAGARGAVAGMVRTTEIHVAPEVSGHLARYLVEPGQKVARGQPVAVLTNPELWAAVGLARAAVDQARSVRDRVYAGVRDEQVQSLQREIVKAQAVHDQDVRDLARKTTLAARSDSSIQDLDTATAAEARSRADIAVAEARYAEAQRGPTTEDRAVADATVGAAEAALAVVEARATKMLLRAPSSGVVAILAAEVGEAIVPGEPILTLFPDNGLWFGFTLREDALAGVRLGADVAVQGARPGQVIPSKVVELRNWGEFAAWRAARATGDHDLNAFFLRLDPVAPVADLTPGETVWFSPPR